MTYPPGTLHPTNHPDPRNRLTWSILLQLAAMQLREYEREHDTQEKKQWQARITQTINEAGELFPLKTWAAMKPPTPPTLAYHAPANSASWLESMITRLNAIFGSASPAATLRTKP